MFGGWANRTSTFVPPLKSMPYLMPPLRKIVAQPITSKMPLKAKKYLALPIQSILGCLKISIMPLRFPSLDSREFVFVPGPRASGTRTPESSLDTHFRLAIHLRQVILENRLGHVNGREYVGNQTDRQGHRETADRSGPKDEEEKGGNDGRNVGVDNGQKRFVK